MNFNITYKNYDTLFQNSKEKKITGEKKTPRIKYVITLRVRKKSRPFVFWENLRQANLLSVEYHL